MDIKYIISGIIDYFKSSDDKFGKAMLYTVTDGECEAARGNHQDPLVKLLLNIKQLQKPLLEWMMERLLEVAVDNR